MAIALTSAFSASNLTNNGTSIAATYAGGNSATAGDLLVVCWLASTVNTNVTLNNSFTKGVTHDEAGIFTVGIGFKVATGGETSCTVSMAGQPNGDVYAQIFRCTGAKSSSPNDRTATNDSGGSQVLTLATGTSAALTQADECVFTLMGYAGAMSALTWTNAGSPLLAQNKLVSGFRTVSATTAVSDTGTWTSANFTSAALLTFMAAPLVGGGWRIT